MLWGHSQGGHAALFAASLAETYAAELVLLGVATAAPATNLSVLLEADINSVPGRILAAMTLLSWSRNFSFPLNGLINANTLKIIQHIDKHCVDDLGGKLGALSAEQDLGANFLNYDPDTRQPWRDLLVANTPRTAGIVVPVLIAQGGSDTLVLPSVTAEYVRALCRSDKAVSYLTLPGIDRRKERAASGELGGEPLQRRPFLRHLRKITSAVSVEATVRQPAFGQSALRQTAFRQRVTWQTTLRGRFAFDVTNDDATANRLAVICGLIESASARALAGDGLFTALRLLRLRRDDDLQYRPYGARNRDEREPTYHSPSCGEPDL